MKHAEVSMVVPSEVEHRVQPGESKINETCLLPALAYGKAYNKASHLGRKSVYCGYSHG